MENSKKKKISGKKSGKSVNFEILKWRMIGSDLACIGILTNCDGIAPRIIIKSRMGDSGVADETRCKMMQHKNCEIQTFQYQR